MDWLQRMNAAISYMEDNLASEISYEEAARRAYCSLYHFQRLFSFITDVPLSEYVRRRRLTLAAFELQNTDVKIINIALKYGYDSPNSFTRAFQALHGVTPTSARSRGIELKAYPRMSFHISIKGDVEMNYKIVEKGPFSVFGVEQVMSTIGGQNYKDIPQFWLKAISDGTLDRICKASDIKWDENSRGIKPVNAVMCYRNTGENSFPYMLFAFTPESGVPEGFTTAEIPAMTWAVFTTEEHTEDQTSNVVQSLFKRIYSEWFPTSGYEPLNGAEFELYGVSDKGLEYCEIWIPVTKK